MWKCCQDQFQLPMKGEACDNNEEKDWRLKLELATLVLATLPHFHIQLSNIQYPLFNDGGANWILAVGCWIFAHSTHAFFPFARCGGQGETNTTKET